MRKAIGVLCALTLLAGCGQSTTPSSVNTPDPNAPEQNAAGDIPDNQVFVPFSPADHTFTVSVPEGWARTTDGGATVFSDKFNSVRVESMSRPAPVTVTTATADEVPTLQGLPGYRAGAVETARRTAGDAVLITYEVTSPSDPVTGKTVTDAVERYEFWHGGTEAIITLSGPKGADNVDPWRTVSDSLRWP